MKRRVRLRHIIRHAGGFPTLQVVGSLPTLPTLPTLDTTKNKTDTSTVPKQRRWHAEHIYKRHLSPRRELATIATAIATAPDSKVANRQNIVSQSRQTNKLGTAVVAAKCGPVAHALRALAPLMVEEKLAFQTANARTAAGARNP